MEIVFNVKMDVPNVKKIMVKFHVPSVKMDSTFQNLQMDKLFAKPVHQLEVNFNYAIKMIMVIKVL